MQTRTQSKGRWRAAFKRRLTGRLLLRFHMFLILAGVMASGVAVSKVLLVSGVTSLVVRYPIAVCVSYVMFFGLVRLWLWYVTRSQVVEPAVVVDGEDVADATELAVDLAVDGSSAGGGGSSGGGSSSFDLDLDGEGAIILIVLGVALAVLFGAGVFLIYQAPAILGEAALQVVLASSLVRASRRIDEPGWAGSVLRATIVPFGIVLAIAAIAGGVCQSLCPQAAKLAEVLRMCVFN